MILLRVEQSPPARRPTRVRSPCPYSSGMAEKTERAKGSCPLCHRLDISHRVVIGRFERHVCRQCADSYKKTKGVDVEALPST